MCKRLNTDTVTVERLINPGGYVFPEAYTSASGGTFNMTLGRVVDGVVYCQFTLSSFTSSGRRRRDTVTALSQSTSYYPLIAIGNLDSSSKSIFD